MSIQDIIKKNQEIYEKLYPPELRVFVEAQKKLNSSILISDKLEHLSNSLKHLPSIIKYSAVIEKITRAMAQSPLQQLGNLALINPLIAPNTSVLDTLGAIAVANTLKTPNARALKALGELAIANTWKANSYDFLDLISIEEETEDEKIIIDETSRIKRIITDIYKDNSILTIIEPREFEEMIAELMISQGFEVELTKQTRDNGYDIIALKYLDSHIPMKFLVECKRFTKQKVGVEIIRSFKEVIATEKANRGIIVTTSYFSAEATKKQKEIPYLLDFRDKDNVLDWVKSYWLQKTSR